MGRKPEKNPLQCCHIGSQNQTEQQHKRPAPQEMHMMLSGTDTHTKSLQGKSSIKLQMKFYESVCPYVYACTKVKNKINNR